MDYMVMNNYGLHGIAVTAITSITAAVAFTPLPLSLMPLCLMPYAFESLLLPF